MVTNLINKTEKRAASHSTIVAFWQAVANRKYSSRSCSGMVILKPEHEA